MKKQLQKLGILVAFCSFGLSAMAQTFDDGILVYSLTTGTDVRVGNNFSSVSSGLVAGTSYSGSISIPATVDYNGTTYNVVEIGSSAFGACTGLAAVTIPSSVTFIQAEAFQGCNGLTTITIPSSVTNIGARAFSGCGSLTTINVSGTNFKLANNVGSAQVLIHYNELGLNATCSNVVGSLAIGELTIPSTAYSIANNAFFNCRGLTGTLTIPNLVSSIGDYAFYNCSSLTSIISLRESPPTLNVAAFLNVPTSIPVSVPCSSENNYQAANGWADFTNYSNCINTLGINETNQLNVQLYPNPASSLVILSNIPFQSTVNILDITCKVVYSSTITNEHTTINTADFTNGIYLVKINNNGNMTNKKLVINK